ncbi:MAG: histidine kinase [Euryarchaeota archaeon]|nr:histidine kinase [Euryarchaeota archaeon]
MDDRQLEARLARLEEELAALESSRPAHSPKVDLELRIDELHEEISRIRTELGR